MSHAFKAMFKEVIAIASPLSELDDTPRVRCIARLVVPYETCLHVSVTDSIDETTCTFS